MGRIIIQPEPAQHCQTLTGESLVHLDRIEIADCQAGPIHQLARCRHGTDAHDTWLDPGRRKAEDAGASGGTSVGVLPAFRLMRRPGRVQQLSHFDRDGRDLHVR